MPFITGEFYAATGIRLHELQDFTRWIKKNSYYHGLLAHRGQIEEIPHLIGEGFPKWPQLKPSESRRNSYSRAEGPVAGSSEPAGSLPAAPTQETPAEEPPMVEAPVPGPSHSSPPAAPTQETPAEEPPLVEAPVPGSSHSSPPAPMETGGVGDGQSWADRAEASAEAEFRQVQPPKRPHSQSRRRGVGLTLPFPLQYLEGRHAAVMKLYDHAAEQPPPRDGIAGEVIRHLHSHMLPCDARHLGNQVVCMIAEYHLTCSSRVTSTESPILPEAAKPLLPNLKSYVPHISFEGTQDVRVVDRAKALRVVVWLHRLDMSAQGDEVASETLDTSRHCLVCLLESFLVPATHGLSFREVVARCLYENWHDAQLRLDDLLACRNRVREELEGLVHAHRESMGADQRRVKKDMDLRRHDLESLKARISFVESHLQEGSPERDVQDNPPQGDADTEMSPEARADDAPSDNAVTPDPGPNTDEDPAMELEINAGTVSPPPSSPVSRDDDDLFSGNVAAGVEVGLAHLTVLSPSGQEVEGEEASRVEAPPPPVEV